MSSANPLSRPKPPKAVAKVDPLQGVGGRQQSFGHIDDLHRCTVVHAASVGWENKTLPTQNSGEPINFRPAVGLHIDL